MTESENWRLFETGRRSSSGGTLSALAERVYRGKKQQYHPRWENAAQDQLAVVEYKPIDVMLRRELQLHMRNIPSSATHHFRRTQDEVGGVKRTHWAVETPEFSDGDKKTKVEMRVELLDGKLDEVDFSLGFSSLTLFPQEGKYILISDASKKEDWREGKIEELWDKGEDGIARKGDVLTYFETLMDGTPINSEGKTATIEQIREDIKNFVVQKPAA